ncbi:MAG: tetratricopeptide (TPR) repeat protein [Cryomorphaceae bacterium]
MTKSLEILFYQSMKRRKALCVLGALLAGGNRGFACLWDTDTLADEVAIQANSLDLILGQFPHHGDVYYKMRIARILKQVEMSQADLNDIAVAYVRTKDFNSAEKYLTEALARDPKHYETLSNIGVTAKKQGGFARGAEYIEKALAIKPGGHMGLGDWYLKALLWRQKHEQANPQEPVEVNFLGQLYSESFSTKYYGMDDAGAGKDMGKLRQAMMIKNDQNFADGFLFFGDYLKDKGALHLAFLAHTRAMMLGHQNPDEVRRRRRAYLQYHGTFPGKRSKPIKASMRNKPWARGIAKAESMINKGAAWLEAYKAAETELLKGKTNEKEVKIKMVETELLKRKILRVRST